MKQFDYLILGSGIAGLTFALSVAPRGRVAIVTKKDRAESNTNYAQGGIASVTSKTDSRYAHGGRGAVQGERRPHDCGGRPGAHRRVDRVGDEIFRK
jgi:aspartate oxidase